MILFFKKVLFCNFSWFNNLTYCCLQKLIAPHPEPECNSTIFLNSFNRQISQHLWMLKNKTINTESKTTSGFSTYPYLLDKNLKYILKAEWVQKFKHLFLKFPFVSSSHLVVLKLWCLRGCMCDITCILCTEWFCLYISLTYWFKQLPCRIISCDSKSCQYDQEQSGTKCMAH